MGNRKLAFFNKTSQFFEISWWFKSKCWYNFKRSYWEGTKNLYLSCTNQLVFRNTLLKSIHPNVALFWTLSGTLTSQIKYHISICIMYVYMHIRWPLLPLTFKNESVISVIPNYYHLVNVFCDFNISYVLTPFCSQNLYFLQLSFKWKCFARRMFAVIPF